MLPQQSINGGSGGAAFGLAGLHSYRFLTPSGLPPLRENFGGSCYQLTMEAAAMATTLTPTHPKFCFCLRPCAVLR